jgi:hypothetical protein
MEVRRSVIIEVHRDHDSKEPTDGSSRRQTRFIANTGILHARDVYRAESA